MPAHDWEDEPTSPFATPPPRGKRRRRTTETCPLCGTRNVLSVTEVKTGYLCEECAGEPDLLDGGG